jgi:hypothetical protein
MQDKARTARLTDADHDSSLMQLGLSLALEMSRYVHRFLSSEIERGVTFSSFKTRNWRG